VESPSTVKRFKNAALLLLQIGFTGTRNSTNFAPLQMIHVSLHA
jgi:hypothetical protein